jgi:cobaltochelatase CobS
MRDREIENGEYHELFGYALTLAENRQPLMLIGPFGTGKSFLAKQIADFLKLAYSETPMSPGATRGDLLGRHTLDGFITSEFVERYSGGGVFNFEEIDASDPSMLIVLNNALASDHLYNSANGEVYERHEDFVPVSTANTFGLGANRDYTGRERLDAATIDRWRMGRIFLPLDEKIEDVILG